MLNTSAILFLNILSVLTLPSLNRPPGEKVWVIKTLAGRLCTSVVAMETTVLNFLDHKCSQIFKKYSEIFEKQNCRGIQHSV